MRTEPPNGDEFARLLATMKAQVLESTADDPEPRPHRTRVRNGVAGAVAAIALLLGVGAGAAFAFGLWPEAPEAESPAAHATATPSLAPSPTSTITHEQYTAVPKPSPIAAAIEISSEGVSVIADDGSVFASMDYFDDAELAVSTLIGYLGEPTVSEVRSQGDTFTGTRYEWDGLTLDDTARPTAWPDTPDFFILASSPSAGGLIIRTAPGAGSSDGLSVGDFSSEIVVEDRWVEYAEYPSNRAMRGTRFGLSESLPPSEEYPDHERNFGIWALTDVELGVIESLYAPSSNWGS